MHSIPLATEAAFTLFELHFLILSAEEAIMLMSEVGFSHKS